MEKWPQLQSDQQKIAAPQSKPKRMFRPALKVSLTTVFSLVQSFSDTPFMDFIIANMAWRCAAVISRIRMSPSFSSDVLA